MVRPLSSDRSPGDFHLEGKVVKPDRTERPDSCSRVILCLDSVIYIIYTIIGQPLLFLGCPSPPLGPPGPQPLGGLVIMMGARGLGQDRLPEVPLLLRHLEERASPRLPSHAVHEPGVPVLPGQKGLGRFVPYVRAEGLTGLRREPRGERERGRLEGRLGLVFQPSARKMTSGGLNGPTCP